MVSTAASQGRGIHVVGVRRVDGEGGGRLAGEEVRDVGPGHSAVGAAVNAVAVVRVAGEGTFTGAHVDDSVVARSEGESAHRLRVGVLGPRRPPAGGRVIGPHPALGGAEHQRAVIADDERTDAPAHGGEGARGAHLLDDGVRPLNDPRAASRLALDCLVGDAGGLLACVKPQPGGLLHAQRVVTGQQPARVVGIAQLVEPCLLRPVLALTLGREPRRGVVGARARAGGCWGDRRQIADAEGGDHERDDRKPGPTHTSSTKSRGPECRVGGFPVARRRLWQMGRADRKWTGDRDPIVIRLTSVFSRRRCSR